MKGLIIYSSNTGNTKKMAEKLYDYLKDSGDWNIRPLADGTDTEGYDVILFGGWAQDTMMNKEALEAFKQMDKTGKKVGLFLTMGTSPETDYGKLCISNVEKLLEGQDSLGVQVLRGMVPEVLVQRLMNLPEGTIPQVIKDAMKEAYETYEDPAEEDYKKAAEYFLNKIK